MQPYEVHAATHTQKRLHSTKPIAAMLQETPQQIAIFVYMAISRLIFLITLNVRNADSAIAYRNGSQ